MAEAIGTEAASETSDCLCLSGTAPLAGHGAVAAEQQGLVFVAAVVVGRSCGEQLALRTDDGSRLSVRVSAGAWVSLDLGSRVELAVGPEGRPVGITARG